MNLNADSQLIKEINALPDGDCICHGDFHPYNILIKSDGTPFILDFMNVCYGPFLYDIARTFSILCETSNSLADEYLNKMKLSKDDIEEYISIIDKCRKYEKALNSFIIKH